MRHFSLSHAISYKEVVALATDTTHFMLIEQTDEKFKPGYDLNRMAFAEPAYQ